MLTKDPSKRPSCSEILVHDWFIDSSQYKRQSMSITTKKYLENMKKFDAMSKLAQSILSYIVNNISYKDVKDDALNVFRNLDTNGDGRITEEELLQGFKEIFKLKAEDDIIREVKEIVAEIDTNHSGSIDYTEFLVCSMQKEILKSKNKVGMMERILSDSGG